MSSLSEAVDRLLGQGLPLGEAISKALDPDPKPVPPERGE